MLREAVISSNVAAIGHDPVTQILEVQYRPDKHGRSNVYAFTSVTAEQHAELMTAPSVGKALNALRDLPRVQGAKIATIDGDGNEVAA